MTSPPPLRDKLASEIATTPWPILEAHHHREALFLVDPTIALIDVAVAIAEDRADVLKGWLEASRVARPTDDEAAAWSENESVRFLFVIVQPFVLAQRMSADDTS